MLKQQYNDYMDEASLEDIIANSFRNFHAKGLDYICLKRSELLTVKVYFLDGDVSKVPEVVNPHNHRYDFTTTVLAGSMIDHRFTPTPMGGQVYDLFEYMTPLNGGDGFTHVGEMRLSPMYSSRLHKGERLHTSAHHRHTIQMLEDQTVLVLRQYADTVPLEEPTQTWVKQGAHAPSTSGVYDRFTEDQALARLRQLNDIMAG